MQDDDHRNGLVTCQSIKLGYSSRLGKKMV